MDLKRAIIKAYRTAQERDWDTIYLLVDAHDTICESNYKDAEADFYPQAIKYLKLICAFPEIYPVLWTSCYPSEGPKYISRLHKGVGDGYRYEVIRKFERPTFTFNAKYCPDTWSH